MDPTFQHQLILSVIDKLLLGGVVGLAGYIANRSLEKHRSRHALQAEVARRRVEAAATVWQAVGKVEVAARRYSDTLVRAALEAVRGMGDKTIPDPIPDDHQALATLLSIHGGKVMHGTVADSFVSKIGPVADALNATIAELGESITSNRFWLGAEAAKRVKAYRRAVFGFYEEMWTALPINYLNYRSRLEQN